jgi:hypothetical protein
MDTGWKVILNTATLLMHLSNWLAIVNFAEELSYYRPNRQRFNKLLAAYLRRDDDVDAEPDDFDYQKRKRSFFRENGEFEWAFG